MNFRVFCWFCSWIRAPGGRFFELGDGVIKGLRGQVHVADADNGLRISAKPSRYRGAGDPEACNDARVSGLTDQLSEPRIVGFLLAAQRFHGGDYRQERLLSKGMDNITLGCLAMGTGIRSRLARTRTDRYRMLVFAAGLWAMGASVRYALSLKPRC